MADSPGSMSTTPHEPGAAVHVPAISLSALCLIHCLALPLMAVSMPALAAAAEAEWVHKVFVALAFPVSGFAIWQCLRSPRRHYVFIGLALIGLALLGAGAFIHDLEAYETPLTVLGGVVLGSAHIIHWIGHRKNADCCHTP